MTAIAARSTRLPGEVSPVGLRLPEGLAYEEWWNVGQELTKYQRAADWSIADWLFYGEWEYGRRFEAGMELTGLTYQRLADLKYVAGRFDISRRREELSIEHHREVAGMPAPEGDRLLAQAAEEGWSRQQLRDAIAGERPPKPVAASEVVAEPVAAPVDPLLHENELLRTALELLLAWAHGDKSADFAEAERLATEALKL